MPTRVLQEQCQSIVLGKNVAITGNVPAASPAAGPVAGAYAPQNLQSAYNLLSLVATDTTVQTVAIVDAYADPKLGSDMVTYRNQYSLPTCNTTTGAGCLTVLNQNGQASLSGIPKDSTGGWEAEQALDVEMVAAICPVCKIVMYEANSASTFDLGTAENSAASTAQFVSNSWSGFDEPGESFLDTQFFNHPGVVTAFASGDFGYGAGYPASSELVTSVGGTYLTPSTNARGWSEKVWDLPTTDGATGSGCSAGEPKPAWQTDPGCANRTENDVAAVADGPHGISVYDTYGGNAGCTTWCALVGTSAATPIITSVYALAGTPTANTYPSQYLYQNSASTGFNRVTSGSDGTCESSRLYLCNAADSLNGYNGPTGWGTPNGVSAFAAPTSAGNTVSVINPGTYDLEAGIAYTLPAITAYDSASGQTLTYSQQGLPSGLSIDSSTGAITGTLPTTPATSAVKVTVTDGSGASSTVAFKIVGAPELEAGYHPGTGPVHLNWGGKCMDDKGGSSTQGTKIEIWTCNGQSSQNWAYYPDANPGGAGELRIKGACLDVVNGGTANGAKLQLWPCIPSDPTEQWYIAGAAGELINAVSGKCVEDPGFSTTNGSQLDIWTCNGGNNQAWTLPASPVLSGVAGKCMDDAGDSSVNGNRIISYHCNGLASQKWSISLSGQLKINGKCLDAKGGSTLNGTQMELYTCHSTSFPNQVWVVANGELENVLAQKCLANPGNSTADGTRLVLEDCYGQPGEIWAES